MILNQRTIGGTLLFVPFTELGAKYDSIDLDKCFERTAENVNRKFYISRSDFRDAGAPMATDFISDDAMERIADYLRDVFQTYNPSNIETDDEFSEALFKEEEDFLVEIGIPYYEDDDISPFNVGDRVFHFGAFGRCYAKVVGIEGEMLKLEADDGQAFNAETWETVKEY